MEDETEEGELKVDTVGTKRWKDKKGKLHRLAGPAVIYFDGEMWWIRHGKRHRDDGPAIEWPSENKSVWYKDGVKYEPSAHELIAWKMKKKEFAER